MGNENNDIFEIDEDGCLYGFKEDIDGTEFEEITIFEGVTSIGGSAFENCENLTSISIPEGVTSIGDSAFYCCCSLESISIPEDVTSIGEYAFDGCENLTSISIPEGVTYIGDSAFGCEKLEGQLLIYDNGSECYGWIGDKTNCTQISIPEGVTSISSGAFKDCENLVSISIPESVTSIGEAAFEGCKSLTSISIPEGVTYICGYTFGECTNLEKVILPNSLTTIARRAFNECEKLKEINIPKSVTDLDKEAFEGCKGLKITRSSTQRSDSEENSSPETEKNGYTEFWDKVKEQSGLSFTNQGRAYINIKSKHKGCIYSVVVSTKNNDITISFDSFARKTNEGDFMEDISSDTALRDKIQTAINKAKKKVKLSAAEQGQKRKDKWEWDEKIDWSGNNDEDAKVLSEEMVPFFNFFEGLEF